MSGPGQHLNPVQASTGFSAGTTSVPGRRWCHPVAESPRFRAASGLPPFLAGRVAQALVALSMATCVDPGGTKLSFPSSCCFCRVIWLTVCQAPLLAGAQPLRPLTQKGGCPSDDSGWDGCCRPSRAARGAIEQIAAYGPVDSKPLARIVSPISRGKKLSLGLDRRVHRNGTALAPPV